MVTRTVVETYGWFTDPKNFCDIGCHLPFLRDSAKGNVLEIGTRDGASTSALLLGLRARGGHLWSVDIDARCSLIFPMDPQWTFICADSRLNADRVLAQIPPRLDLLFIDGDHSYEMVNSDLKIYGPRAKTIMLHDVDQENVYEAADEYAIGIDKELLIRQGDNGLGVIRQ